MFTWDSSSSVRVSLYFLNLSSSVLMSEGPAMSAVLLLEVGAASPAEEAEAEDA
jgi:hypothetical protein